MESFKWSEEDSTVFPMNTFGNSYNACFFNPKTGKVGLTHNVGKWVESMAELRPEIEWFAKEFPEVELYLTFEDYPTKGTTDVTSSCWYTEPFATIHLKDGKIEIVKTRKIKKEIRNPIEHSNTYYSIRNFFENIFRKIFEKVTPYRYCFWRNFKLFNKKDGIIDEGFYSTRDFLAIIEWWQNECVEYWKK